MTKIIEAETQKFMKAQMPKIHGSHDSVSARFVVYNPTVAGSRRTLRGQRRLARRGRHAYLLVPPQGQRRSTGSSTPISRSVKPKRRPACPTRNRCPPRPVRRNSVVLHSAFTLTTNPRTQIPKNMAATMQFQPGLLFTTQLPPEADAHYAGKGVSLGAADTPIFWYRPKDAKKYRVIYADLSVREAETPPSVPDAQPVPAPSSPKE